VNKTSASATQFVKCILLHTFFTYNCSSQLRELTRSFCNTDELFNT